MVYLISYDLNKADKNYTDLYDAIKKASTGAWWHYLDSTWIIKSNLTVADVSNRLKATMDNNDSLLVIEVKNNYAGWLKKEAWDYLRDVIFA